MSADLANQYAKGIDAAYSKMVKRVGRAEADKWRTNAISSAQMYAAKTQAERERVGRSSSLKG